MNRTIEITERFAVMVWAAMTGSPLETARLALGHTRFSVVAEQAVNAESAVNQDVETAVCNVAFRVCRAACERRAA